MSNLDNIVREYEAARAAFEEKVKDGLNTAFSEFFAKYPEFSSIEWEQYTDYFNDGEECTFSVHEKTYTPNEEMFPRIDERRGFREPSAYERSSKYYTEEVAFYDAFPDSVKARFNALENAWEDFKATLDSIPEELYQDVFGDHKRIVVTAEGITVEDFSDHD